MRKQEAAMGLGSATGQQRQESVAVPFIMYSPENGF